MPGFDGTGPGGQGPMTGRGEGYCAVEIPESGESPYGYAGLQGMPVRLIVPATWPALGGRLARRMHPATRFGRRRGRGAGRGRGRRFGRW